MQHSISFEFPRETISGIELRWPFERWIIYEAAINISCLKFQKFAAEVSTKLMSIVSLWFYRETKKFHS